MAQNLATFERMKWNSDDKAMLIIDSSEVKRVLLKHVPPSAMSIGFGKIKKSIVRMQINVVTAWMAWWTAKFLLWTGKTSTPIASVAAKIPRVLVRSLSHVFYES